jgi:tetratricopeptide (TPR) repeat protein
MDNLSNNSFDLVLAWENTLISFPVGLSTAETVEADIKRVMSGPSAGDYYAAGNYLYQEGKDIKQAYEWISKANSMDPRFFRVRTEALILADMGRFAEAVAVAEKSIAMAKEAGNNDYVRMNEESIAKWKPMIPPPAPAAAPQKTTKKSKSK